MKNRRFTRNVIITSLVGLLILSGAGYFYYYHTTSGVLRRNGISTNHIRMSMENQWFRFYLYEKKRGETKELGILTLHKDTDSSSWRMYSNSSITEQGVQETIRTAYPIVRNGSLVSHFVWGGYVKEVRSPDVVSIQVNGTLMKPDYVKAGANGTVYFFHDIEEVSGPIQIVTEK